jgi:hypothetical protein
MIGLMKLLESLKEFVEDYFKKILLLTLNTLFLMYEIHLES